MIVYVADSAENLAAMGAARSILAGRPAGRSPTLGAQAPAIVIRRGAYTYRQLNAWRAVIDTAVLTVLCLACITSTLTRDGTASS